MLLAASPLVATDYYVSPDGNDGNDGSLGHPLGTLHEAFWQARSPGDRILLMSGKIRLGPGDWTEAVTWGGGAEGNPIVMERAPGATPEVDMSRGRFYIKHDYWVVRGLPDRKLKFTPCNSIVWTVLARHFTIEDCEFDVSYEVFRTGGYSSADVNFRGNIVWLGGRDDQSSVTSYRAQGGVIEHNEFHFVGQKAAGLAFKGAARDVVIRYNKFIVHPGVTSVATGLYLGAFFSGWPSSLYQSVNMLVHDNLFYNYPGTAIVMRSAKDCGIYHNTYYGSGPFVTLMPWAYWNGVAPRNITIGNNIIYADNPAKLLTVYSGCDDGFLSDSNLVYSPVGEPTVSWLGRTMSFADYVAATGNDTHSIVADPLLASLPGGDLRLQPTSPAIDVRGAFRFGWNDLAGTQRPSGDGYDLGCYETPRENTAPAPVGTLTAQDKPQDDGGRIELDWSGYAPPSDFDHYNIYRGTSSFDDVTPMAPLAQISYVLGDITSHTDATTINATDYYYAVTAVDATGLEDKAVQSVGPVRSVDQNDPPPPPISSLAAHDTPDDYGGSIDLDWSGYSAPADFDHYNVYRDTSAFSDVTWMTPLTALTHGSETSHTDATTTDGSDYYYAVTCVDKNGNEQKAVIAAGPVRSVSNWRPWPGGKAAAVSLTYDDGNLSSYNDRQTLARYGFKATYFINTGRLGNPHKITWPMVRELYDAGHEIASHTRDHAHPGQTSRQELWMQQDLWFDDMLVNTTIPEDDLRRSFAYPHGLFDDYYAHDVLPKYYLSARTIVRGLIHRPPVDWHLLPAHIIDHGPVDILLEIVDQAVAKEEWLILLAHRWYDPAFLDALATRNVWVAPQGEVVRHLLGDDAPDLPPLRIIGLNVYDTPGDADGSISLDWPGYHVPNDFGQYRLYRATSSFNDVSGMAPIAVVTTPAQTAYTDTTAAEGTPYYYAVTCVDAGGNEIKAVISAAPAPDPIETLAAQDTPGDSGGSIDLSWTGYSPPVDFAEYRIYRATSSFNNVSEMEPIATVADASQTTYTDATTTDGTNYYYAATCVDTDGNENKAVTSVGPVQSLDKDAAPDPIAALTAEDTPGDSGGSIDLDWSGYSAPADSDHYNIYRSTSSFSDVSEMEPIATVDDASQTTYSDATTTDGTDYYYAVTCVDTDGKENKSVTSVGPVQSLNDEDTPPDPIDALAAHDTPDDDGGAIDLDWSGYSAPADSDHYNIYRAAASFSDVSEMEPIATVTDASATTYTDASTTDGTDYYYAVTCVDTDGKENKSVTSVGPVQSVDDTAIPPDAATALSVQDTPDDDGGSIDLDWTGYTPPDDFSNYRVYRATSSFDDVSDLTPIATVDDASQTTYSDATTTDGTDYYYAVTCVDTDGKENKSVTAVGPVQSVDDLGPTILHTFATGSTSTQPVKMLVTMPATPSDPDLSANEIFGTDQIARWDPAMPDYVYLYDAPNDPLFAVRPGAGFWVNFTTETTVSFNGRRPSANAPFETSINPQWNLLGNPWTTAMPWSSVTASPQGSIVSFGWIYEGSGGYELVSSVTALNAVSSVPAYRALWVHASPDADKLIISAPGAQTASAASRGADALPIRWLVPIMVSAGDKRDVCNGIGAADTDVLIDNPPAAPDGVDAYLTPITNPTARMAYELRSATGTQRFNLTVATELPNTDVTVAVPDLSQLPKDYRVTLRDLDTGNVRHMRTARAYTYNSGPAGGQRQFAIEVGSAISGALAVTGATVVPSRGTGAEIRYNISDAATVTTRIYNVAGRLVAELERGRSVARGAVATVWDGRSAMGTVTPNGAYVLEIAAAGQDGQRARAVCPFVVSR